MSADAYEDIAATIIDGQVTIMGAVAYKLANEVPGLTVEEGGRPSISGSGPEAIDALVKQYSSITGPLGVRMCYSHAQAAIQRHEITVPAFAAFA